MYICICIYRYGGGSTMERKCIFRDPFADNAATGTISTSNDAPRPRAHFAHISRTANALSTTLFIFYRR